LRSGDVSTAGIFSDYDGELVNLAFPQVQHSLKISSSVLAPLISIIKLGTLLATFITAQPTASDAAGC
jgi:hypothetical protein